MRDITSSKSVGIAAVAMLASIGLSACVSTVPAPRSAMLASAPLTVDQAHPKLASFRKDGFDPAAYRAVMIDPVMFKAASRKPVDEATQKMLIDELREQLSQTIGQRFAITDQPGVGVLRVKSAITSIGTPDKVLNGVAMLAVFVPATAGGAAIEAEVTDSVSGERVAALAGTISGGKGPKGFLTTYTQAKRALAALSQQLDRIIAGRPANRA